MKGDASDETQILTFLKNTTAVGLLPVPHPILIRRYRATLHTHVWFHSFMWGVVFLHNMRPTMTWPQNAIRLFVVQHPATKQQQQQQQQQHQQQQQSTQQATSPSNK
jgi:hypothetical protein